MNLTTYTGEEIGILGSFYTLIEYGEKNGMLSSLLVRGKCSNLMCPDDLVKFKVHLEGVHNLVGGGINRKAFDLLHKHTTAGMLYYTLPIKCTC